MLGTVQEDSAGSPASALVRESVQKGLNPSIWRYFQKRQQPRRRGGGVHSILVSRFKRETGEMSRDTFENLSLSRVSCLRHQKQKNILVSRFRHKKMILSRDSSEDSALSRDSCLAFQKRVEDTMARTHTSLYSFYYF